MWYVRMKYSDLRRGDILKIVNAGAPGFAELGDLVRVLDVYQEGVKVEDKHGKTCEFVYNCGIARLEKTQWQDDFPDQNIQMEHRHL